MGERERIKCLKASKVKVLGKDVVASYKVICAMAILPLACISYSSLLYLILRHYAIKHKTLYTLLFLILYPVYSFAMLKTSDITVALARNIKAKLLFLFNENRYEQLKKSRLTL